MPVDMLDPGPDYDGTPAYLAWPRDANGSPASSDTHQPAEVVFPQPGGAPVSRGTVRHGDRLIDLTIRDAQGNPLRPPTIPLEVVRQLWAAHYG